MIKSITNFSYKSLQITDVDIEKMPILDIFIRMFIDEAFCLAKHGLRSNYETIAENRSYFKGKILFPEQQKYNSFHKERVFTESDEFTPNCPENRLIKSVFQLPVKAPSIDRVPSALYTVPIRSIIELLVLAVPASVLEAFPVIEEVDPVFAPFADLPFPSVKVF